jgi:cytoskeletal protein CcmA (bactofilin family)
MSGTGGVRIDGAFDGDIAVHGIVVIGEQGRVTCKQIKAATVVISGSLKGDVTAYKVEITGSGRVWGDVITTSFSTEEGAFLRGNITMEDQLDLGFVEENPAEYEDDPEGEGEAQEEET